MRPDAYTKAVLTVIAGCLVWLCAMSTGRPLSAQQTMQFGGVTPQPVFIVGWGTIDEKGQASVVDGAGPRRSPQRSERAGEARRRACRLPWTCA